MDGTMEAARNKSATFQPQKAVAAAAFLIEKTGQSLYTLMKMLYLADRLHLSRHGRFIAGDNYTAMRQGPVPSITYDLFKHVRGERKTVPGTELAERSFEYVGEHNFRLRQEPHLDELSESTLSAYKK